MSNWAKSNRTVLVSSLLFGFLAYGFMIANKIPNFDDTFFLLSKGATIESGRWALCILSLVFPDVSMPWLYGIITLLLMAVASTFIADIFEIKSRISQILLSGAVICFPSLIATFCYMFTSSAYGVAFLLAVLPVWFLKKGTVRSGICGFLCMIFSLGIYQPYVAVTASLLIILLIQRTLGLEPVKKTWLQGVTFLVFLSASLGAYFLIAKLVQWGSGVPMGAYAASRIDFGIGNMLQKIGIVVKHLAAYFLVGDKGLMPTLFSRILHIILVSLSVIYLLARSWRNTGHLILVTVLLVLLPLSINCMFLFTLEDAVHTLVLYGFASVYVLFVVLAEDSRKAGRRSCCKWIYDFVALVLALIIGGNVCIANEAYLYMKLRYEHTQSFYTQLVTELRSDPQFDADTKIAIVGAYHLPQQMRNSFSNVLKIKGTSGIQPHGYNGAAYMRYFMGLDIAFATEAEIADIMNTDAYRSMPLYPYEGAIERIGDYVVVKLS